MLWVSLRLAAAYACMYPFGKREPATEDLVGANTAFLTAVEDSNPGDVGLDKFKARRQQCEYAAAANFAPGAKCLYHDPSAKFFVGFEEQCEFCGNKKVRDDYEDTTTHYPVQCTANDPGIDAYTVEYAPAKTDGIQLAVRPDMPALAETADLLDVLCRDQCSLHLACTAYLALNTRTCLLLGSNPPAHMDAKTTAASGATTTTTTTTSEGTTAPATTTTTNAICSADCDQTIPTSDGYGGCRYIHPDTNTVFCKWSYDLYNNYQCDPIDGIDVYQCVDNTANLVTVAPPTTEPLKFFDTATVASGTTVQQRVIRQKRTAFSRPVLRWALMEVNTFQGLPTMAVDGELTVLKCGSLCQADPTCAHAIWAGTAEGCKYWQTDRAPLGFDDFYWGEDTADPISHVPVIYTALLGGQLWYDPFVEMEAQHATGDPVSLCEGTEITHLRVRSTDINAAGDRFDVRIFNCPNLEELHWLQRAQLRDNSLSNCPSLRKVLFARSVVGYDHELVSSGGFNPVTSCALYPALYFDAQKVGVAVQRTLTAFPSQEQYPTHISPPNNIELDFGYQHLTEIREDAADPCPYGDRITAVLANHNIITAVGPRAFSGFPNLISLDLGHNRITFVSDTAFLDCTALVSLKLHDNQITSLSLALFSSFATRLVQLELQNNYIAELKVPASFPATVNLQYDTDDVTLCAGDAVCSICDYNTFVACGNGPTPAFPETIVNRAIGLEADTLQLPVPPTTYGGIYTEMTAYCIPCDADPLAEIGPHGRGFLGEAITGVTLPFYAECPHLKHAHTVNVGYEVAIDPADLTYELDRTVDYLPKSPQLESFTTSRNLDDRHALLGYRGAPERTGSATTYRLTPCDDRVLVVDGSQAAMPAAFFGCLSSELRVFSLAPVAVGAFTFARMANLRRVRLPKTVSSIHADAFRDSNGITDLLIPGGTTADVNTALGNLGARGCPEPDPCKGPLCAGERQGTEFYGVCNCQRDLPGCFQSDRLAPLPPHQIVDATSPACGPEPVPAMGPLFVSPEETLFYPPGHVPVEVTTKNGATTTMQAPIGRLHELCTGAGAQGLSVLEPPPPPALPARVDNGSGAPALPVEMSRAAEPPEGLPVYAVALVAIGGAGVVLGAAKLLRLV